jgi:hypothetical protein
MKLTELRKIIKEEVRTFRRRNHLLKENMNLSISNNSVELDDNSGKYSSFIENDGTVDFSVVYDDEDDRNGMEFDEDNWKDILGPDHAFVKISEKIPTKVEAMDDYVMITVDLEDLKKIVKTINENKSNKQKKTTELRKIIKEEVRTFRRMQKIAGLLNENETPGNGPEWINPNSPKAKILTNVFYIGDGAEGDLRSLRGSAVPSYELKGYSKKDIKDMGDGFLYIEAGEEGWYDEEEGMFESADENSTTRIEKRYIKLI